MPYESTVCVTVLRRGFENAGEACLAPTDGGIRFTRIEIGHIRAALPKASPQHPAPLPD